MRGRVCPRVRLSGVLGGTEDSGNGGSVGSPSNVKRDSEGFLGGGGAVLSRLGSLGGREVL